VGRRSSGKLNEPEIIIGDRGFGPFRFPVSIKVSDLLTHWHVIGVSGSGKSRFLAVVILAFYKADLPVTLIDPHGDLARLVLSHLAQMGIYSDPEAFEKILYLDLPRAESMNRFLPFNVLALPIKPHTLASNTMEANHRAYPQLAGGAAPMHDILVLNGTKVLISNGYPLPSLYYLLTNKDFRDTLLMRETDSDVVGFFKNQFDKLNVQEQVTQAGSVLRRVQLLCFDPILKYSLGQDNIVLPFRQIMDRGQTVIINLALDNADARRLYGCLLTVFYEQAALSRSDMPSEARTSHHMFIDEFSQFTSQSEEALSRTLSETRKYNLHGIFAHQNWPQASMELKGALLNVGFEVVFALGRTDAEYSAPMIGSINPEKVKHIVRDEKMIDRTHPVFSPIPEQREIGVQDLVDLPKAHAYLKQRGKRAVEFKTSNIEDPDVDPLLLAEIEKEYLTRYFTPQSSAEAMLAKYRPGGKGDMELQSIKTHPPFGVLYGNKGNQTLKRRSEEKENLD
jgi:hypothetical protein